VLLYNLIFNITGTVALQLLYERLQALGYPAFICDDSNRHTPTCATPSGTAIRTVILFMRTVIPSDA
jgi:hypothetical protein